MGKDETRWGVGEALGKAIRVWPCEVSQVMKKHMIQKDYEEEEEENKRKRGRKTGKDRH